MSEKPAVSLPEGVPPGNHGNTVAAWTVTVVVLVGALMSSVALVTGPPWLVWAGGAVVLLGLVAGKVLAILGYGKGGAATLAREARTGSGHRGH